MSRVPPVARLASLLILILATLIDTSLVLLCVAIAVLAVFIASDGLFGRFLKFILFGQLPLMLMLVALWGYVAKAPPGEPLGSDAHAGIIFALLISLRLAVLGGAFQLAMLSIPPRMLPATLRGWGLRGEGLVVALGVFAVEPELKLRAEQILTARRARGLLSGSRLAGFKQTHRLLRPLFVWSIRSAVHRAEAWENRAMLLKVENLPTDAIPFTTLAGFTAIVLSLVYLGLAVTLRWPHPLNIR
jgi:energy-coupling factor transporter transmembrane protein EcfT